MTNIFITRAELLASGETTEDHRKLQQDEVEIVERDKKSSGSHRGGLFRGCFETPLHPNRAPIRDLEDGVDRCPRCAWELEDGVCHSCGHHAFETYPLSGSESPGLSYFTEDGTTAPYLVDEEERDYSESPIVSVSEESGHGDIELSDDSEYTRHVDMEFARTVARRQARTARIAQNARNARNARNSLTSTPEIENRYSPAPSYPGVSTEEELSHTDGYSAEGDDEVGSLDGFVVDDVEEEPSSVQHSPRSSHYDTDEIHDIVPSSSDDNINIRRDSDGSLDGLSSDKETPPFHMEDDSDEVPVQHHRRSFHERSRYSSRGSSGRELDSINSDIRPRPGIAARLARRQAFRRQQENDSAAHIHHTNRELEPSSGRRRVVPDEDESESDPPPLVHRSRRRRRAANIVISDDDDITAASVNDIPVQSRHSSSGTATVGRRSPSHAASSGRNTQMINPMAGISSAIVINSSPTRLEPSSFGWHPYHASTDSLENSFQAPHSRVAVSPRNASIRNRSRAHARRYQRDSSPSPRHPSTQISTPRVPPPVFARSIRDRSNSETNETHQQVARARASRKADRQVLKHQKRRREREQAMLNSEASRLPASADASDTMNVDGGVRFGDWNQEQQANEIVP